MTSAKYINMADNSAKVTTLRNLAITQFIVAFLLFCFGIAEQLVVNYWTSVAFIGIWAGILVSRRLSSVTG